MTYDDRDRRDPNEPGGPDEAAPEKARPEPPPHGASRPPGEGLPREPEPEATEPTEHAWADTTDEAAVPETAPMEPPEPEEPVSDETRTWQTPASEPWPTEPPAAGSQEPGGWPTSAPERREEPTDTWQTAQTPSPEEAESWQAAPDQVAPVEPEWHEPPPSEVEAYNRAPVEPPPAAAAASTAAHSVPDSGGALGESTLCPRCGTENRPGLAFCRNCGQRLAAAGAAATMERPGTPEGSTACPRCGTHNRAGVAFCQNCGANLRGPAPGYVPPAVAAEAAAVAVPARRSAVLGPVVLLIGAIGLVTAYLLPFAYGSGSLFERAWSAGGYGLAFWSGYADVGGSLADQAYFGFAAPVPILIGLLVLLAVAGFVRATPGPLQVIGLVIAMLWSVGLIVLFLVVEVLGNWEGDLLGLLRVLSPAGIIFFLSSLIVLIGTLTRFGRA